MAYHKGTTTSKKCMKKMLSLFILLWSEKNPQIFFFWKTETKYKKKFYREITVKKLGESYKTL